MFSGSLQEHIMNLVTIFQRFRDTYTKVQFDKSEFWIHNHTRRHKALSREDKSRFEVSHYTNKRNQKLPRTTWVL